jgi:hypothetical protein|tara:strand:+ start:973 stop:1482 length:510 start_codon:yes stop_codon:yes gene_type:complete
VDGPVLRSLIEGNGLCRFSTFGIGDPVNGPPGPPASYRDEEVSREGVNREVGGGKAEVAGRLQEGLILVALVGVSPRDERGKVDPPIGPAGEEEAVPVVLGKLGMAIDFHPGGRSTVDLVEPGGGIKKIGRPVEGALVAWEKPAVVSADPDVKDPTVGIPRELVISLSI